jgi:hypothetical protein
MNIIKQIQRKQGTTGYWSRDKCLSRIGAHIVKKEKSFRRMDGCTYVGNPLQLMQDVRSHHAEKLIFAAMLLKWPGKEIVK